jgi:hypothetical protein
MTPPTIEPPPEDGHAKPLLRRLGWFAVLWASGLLAVSATAAGLRWLLGLN